ncbi:hypothetical protein BH23GEM6_BH23GEM6_19380 [soil metagenome]
MVDRTPDLSDRAGSRGAAGDGELLDFVFCDSPLSILVIERETLRFLHANPAAVRLYGYSSAELRKISFQDLVESTYAAAPLTGEPTKAKWAGRMQHRARDGRVLQVEVWQRDITFAGRPARALVVQDLSGQTPSEVAIQESEARWRTLAEVNPNGILLMDDRSVILTVNPAMQRIFGYSAAELVGQPLSILIPERLREQHRHGVERYLATGRRNIPWSGVELPALRKDGVEIPVEIAFGEYVQDGEHVFAGFVGDVTERRRSEARREAEHAVSRILAAATDLEGAVPPILRALCETMRWPLGAFWRVQPEQRQIRCETVWHSDEEGAGQFAESSRSWTFERSQGLPGRVWEGAQPVWITDVRKDSNFPRLKLASDAGFHSALAFPVMAGPDVEGVMEFFAEQIDEPDELLLASVAVIGRDIGEFVRRKRVEAERDRALARAISARQTAEDQALELEAQAEEMQNQALQLEEVEVDLRVANEELVRANALLRERTEEAELASSAAEEASRAKSAFLANMSHELRTPINAIMGYTDLLELGIAGPLNEQQFSHLGRVKSSTEHLLGLINEILDLAKVEAGQLQVNSERVAVGETVREALDLIAPQAAAKGIEMENRTPGMDRILYWGDRDRVRQVLVNLLSNAVKFTDADGRVSVTCHTTDQADAVTALGGGPWIALEVEDNGIGIPPEKLRAVFEPFVQVDPSHTRERGGTGLGLAISRKLAHLMGGDLTARSGLGRGSCFTLWLPAASGAVGESEEAHRWPSGVEEIPRLSEVGSTLIRLAEPIVEETIERLRHEPATPRAAGLDRAQLSDHLATFLVDIGLALVALEEGGGEPSLMRDGTQIQRTIAQLHGAQRARLAWSEEAISCEFEILRTVCLNALRQGLSGSSRASYEVALGIVRRLLEQAERVSLRGWNQTVQEPT